MDHSHEYMMIMKEEEAIAERLRESNRDSVLGVYDARFRRMEAQIWLNEEKAR